LDSWQVVGYPPDVTAEPPEQPEGAVRLARRHFTFDILLSPEALGVSSAS
jgi:hypothetical protein